jgi:NADH-quinone oxidoreductase subunit N
MMTNILPDYSLIAPELTMLTLACVVLLVDLFLKQEQRGYTHALTLISLVITTIVTMATFADSRALTFSNMYVRDGMGDVLKISIFLVSAGAFVYARDYLKMRDLYKGEYYVLGLFAVLGMMIMVSAHNLLVIYMGLELLSLCLYAMVAFNRDSVASSEAAMKYFVLGAVASGMLLYGMSMLYGMSGSLDLAAIAQSIESGPDSSPVMLFGMVFIIAGLAFKFGAVPFHMWVPDVYQGAPTSVTLFIGSAPKLAAFAMAIRLLVETLGGLHADWQQILSVLAILSMGLGNVIAIAQTNIKRMLAYSTISHVGFILLGLIAGNAAGYSSAMFYTVTYALTAIGSFGMIILLSRHGFEAEELDDFKGLNKTHPWFAFVMLLLMFSLAGVPPMVGFYAKLLVLKAVIDVGMVWLALIAVFFSVIGAFYYLRVIKLMYFDERERTEQLVPATDMQVVLSINGIAMLLLGIFPGFLMTLCTVSL